MRPYFSSGELTYSQADALNQLWDSMENMQRMRGAAPVETNWYSGIPVISLGDTGGGNASNNYLVNGSFQVFQRRNASNATFLTGNYSFDRWFLQHDGGANVTVNNNQQAYGAGSYGLIQNQGAGNIGVLVAQPIESLLTAQLVDKPCTFSFSAISASNVTMRIAAFAWTGTADAAGARNLVASWNANHTPTFNTTTLAQLGNTSVAVSNVTYATASLNFTPAAGTRNLTVAAWVEGLPGSFTNFFMSDAYVTPSSAALVRETPADAVLRCSRYYYAPRWSWLPGTYMTNAGDNGNTSILGNTGNGVFSDAILLPPMLKTPTLVQSIPGPITTSGNTIIHNIAKNNLITTPSTVAAGNLTVQFRQSSATTLINGLGEMKWTTGHLGISVNANGSWVGNSAVGAASTAPATGDRMLVRMTDFLQPPVIAFDSEI